MVFPFTTLLVDEVDSRRGTVVPACSVKPFQYALPAAFRGEDKTMDLVRVLHDLRRNKKRRSLMKKEAKAFAMRIVNSFRYSHPSPKLAARFVDCVSEIPNAKIEIIRPSRVENHHPYTSLTGQIGDNLDREGDFSFSPIFRGELLNGAVVGLKGQVIANNKIVLTDVVAEMSRARNDSLLTRSGRIPGPKRFAGTLAVLGCEQPYNFFHWLLDAFPRLAYLDPQIAVDGYYISAEQPFQKEYLKARGVPLEKIIEPKSGLHIVADRLLFTSLPGDDSGRPYSGLKDRGTLDFVSETFDKSPAKRTRRIYVLRRGKRTVQPDGVIHSIIEDAGGFEALHLEDMSAEQQARLFSQAEIIVSPHGAGLTNLVHCSPGTRVLECLSPNYMNTIFRRIAAQRGLRYFQAVGVSKSREKWSVGADIVLDPDSFREVLEKCLQA